MSPNRRTFLGATSAAFAAAYFPVPLSAASRNEVLRTAHIGVGGMGHSDLRSVASHGKVEVAALCDVDQGRLDKAHGEFPKARKFVDYREMLSELGDGVDAVVVSTPDHTHAAAAMTALQAGKPVYCQKPLTHDVYEARRLREVAEEKNLVTQMGIQIHSSAVYRRAVKMIQDGVIGPVSQVHAWSSKNWGYNGGAFTNTAAPPDYLDWDRWLGTASKRAYVPNVYHPAQWRKLIDFGTGTLGDMGVHIFDTPYAALQLTAPKWVKTTCRPPTGIGHPEKNKVEYEFPKTEYTTEGFRWTWYDGAYAPPSTEEVGLPKGTKLPGQASLFIGAKGTMLLPHIGEAILFPRKRFSDFSQPKVEESNHYHQWVDACLGQGKTSASFSYGGPLTEALLLGVIANRFPKEQLQWDADNLEFPEKPEATKLVRRDYREGYRVEGL